jgi:hypothetical protein
MKWNSPSPPLFTSCEEEVVGACADEVMGAMVVAAPRNLRLVVARGAVLALFTPNKLRPSLQICIPRLTAFVAPADHSLEHTFASLLR